MTTFQRVIDIAETAGPKASFPHTRPGLRSKKGERDEQDNPNESYDNQDSSDEIHDFRRIRVISWQDALRVDKLQSQKSGKRGGEPVFNKDDVFFSINLFDTNGQGATSADPVPSYLPDLSYAGDEEGILTDSELISNDPILLSLYEDQHSMLTYSDGSTRADISTSHYINQWILHKLRRSTSELRLFRSTAGYQEVQTKLSQENIKDLVLKWWYKDESGL